MNRWLLFSSGVHFLGLVFVFLLSSFSFSVPKKQNKVFFVDFVGTSVVANVGKKNGGEGNGDSTKKEPVRSPENEPKAEDKPKENVKEEIKVPKAKIEEKKKTDTKKTTTSHDDKGKNNATKTVAKPSTKPVKQASKADYLEAEDFSGELPPPSMAAASGFLPEKSQTAKSSGNGGGEVSEGIGGGGFRTDTDFPYPWYISQVREALFNAWAANSPSVNGLQCTAAFTITRNGGIKNAKIEKSSGNRLFDSAALSAVRASSPFSQLPDDFFEDVLVIHVEFRSSD